jgi:hypothetical protein
MSIVNALAREIAAKVVYYGPGLSGKTTSLKQVYAGIRAESRGQLISLSTEGDRTLFFDFLPVKIEPIGGLGLRLQLYTVPGQVFYDATRKLVLNGADGGGKNSNPHQGPITDLTATSLADSESLKSLARPPRRGKRRAGTGRSTHRSPPGSRCGRRTRALAASRRPRHSS